jgi:hypothetical protein
MLVQWSGAGSMDWLFLEERRRDAGAVMDEGHVLEGDCVVLGRERNIGDEKAKTYFSCSESISGNQI